MDGSLPGNKNKIAVLAVLLIAITGSCRFYFPTTTSRYVAQKTKGSVANGRNLAWNVCAGCHYDESEKKYIGIFLNELPRVGGKLYSANLTHSVAHGIINSYSDADLQYLLKTGIAKNGKFMPYMMRPTMADGDINDIILYFRSSDAPLAPGDTTVGHTRINLVGRIGIRSVSKASPFVRNVLRPDQNNPVQYGAYLSGIIGCYHCHSGKVGGLNYTNPEKSKGYMGGGMKRKDFDGNKVYASNLTPDATEGFASYSGDDFRRAVRRGISPEGDTLSTAMPRFPHLTDKQADAIYAYLEQLPSIRHATR